MGLGPSLFMFKLASIAISVEGPAGADIHSFGGVTLACDDDHQFLAHKAWGHSCLCLILGYPREGCLIFTVSAVLLLRVMTIISFWHTRLVATQVST